MSLSRLVFYSAVVGGWSAFVGWLLGELIFGRSVDESWILTVLMAGLVAAVIGGGLSQVAGLVNMRWGEHIHRILPGLVGGLAGGIAGVLLGSLVNALGGTFGQVLGWVFMGMGIGVAEGVYEKSPKKIRNGLIGGALGGFLGGLLFVPVNRLIGSDMSSRATSFVILGACVGLFIGLVQVVLKEAWLTVEEGFRAGRQLILSEPVTTMGTSERASLIFIAYGAKGVEPTHVQITRQPDGRYLLQDNQSRTGTLLNGQKLAAPMVLRNGDRIQLGPNVVRFNESGSAPAQAPVKTAPAMGIPVAAAPAPVKAVPVAAVPVRPAASAKPQAVAQAKPVPAAAPGAQTPTAGMCPVCQWKGTGIPGRRKCENCGAVF